MATITSYVNNEPMRKRYIEINSLTQVQAWKADSGKGYNPALCRNEAVGIQLTDVFCSTVDDVKAWAEKYCPELKFVPPVKIKVKA